ncbi:MAG: hypothetical protein WDW38_005794 [Sanguina aurantia]
MFRKSNSVNVGPDSRGGSQSPNTEPGSTADSGDGQSSSAAHPSSRLISHRAPGSAYSSAAYGHSKPPGSPNSFVFWPSCEHPGPAVSQSASHHGAGAAAGAAAVAAPEQTCRSRSLGMGRPQIDGRTHAGSRAARQPLQAAFSRVAPLDSTLIRPTTAFSAANLSQFYAGMPSAEEDAELDAKFDRIAGGEGGRNRHEHCNSSGVASIRLLCAPDAGDSAACLQAAPMVLSLGSVLDCTPEVLRREMQLMSAAELREMHANLV